MTKKAQLPLSNLEIGKPKTINDKTIKPCILGINGILRPFNICLKKLNITPSVFGQVAFLFLSARIVIFYYNW